MSTILRNARAADCLRGPDAPVDIRVEGGVIREIGRGLSGDTVIDCGGHVLMPSFVDLHAHFRDPGLTHKEDIASGSRAAVHGGYTFVNLMPNTKPVCSSMAVVEEVRRKAEAAGLCDIHQTVSITKDFDGHTTDHLRELDGSVLWLSDDGFGVDDTAAMLSAMEIARERGIGLMLHEEESALSKIDMYLAEELQTFRDVELALLTGCKVHFCHVSTEKAVRYILSGKERGGDITFEVSPHHLALNDSHGGRVAPPLRREADRLFLLDCVKNGLVDAIATDHAPHTPEEKAAGANGFTGLDLSFATCLTTLVKGGVTTLSELSRLLSHSPARLMGMPEAVIREGAPANLVLVDTETPFLATEEHIASKSKNSPVPGMTLYGTVLMTMKGGRVLYEKAH